MTNSSGPSRSAIAGGGSGVASKARLAAYSSRSGVPDGAGADPAVPGDGAEGFGGEDGLGEAAPVLVVRAVDLLFGGRGNEADVNRNERLVPTLSGPPASPQSPSSTLKPSMTIALPREWGFFNPVTSIAMR